MIGKFGCSKCNGTGVVIGEFGIETECECIREMQEELIKEDKMRTSVIKTPNIFGEMTRDERIEKMRLIPLHRMGDSFEGNHVKIVAIQMCTKLKCKLSSADAVNEYIRTLEQILSELRMRQVPNKSYIIGASNGFGKTTFANTAIKIMATSGMKAVPYISLTELAEKWADAMSRLRCRIEHKNLGVVNKFEVDDDGEDLQVEYDWSDYVNSDLAIVYLTSTNEEVMWIEMQVLKTLLELRDTKGKPTIVMTSESLDWYKNSATVGKYMMTHVLEAQADKFSRDRNEFGEGKDKEAIYTTTESRYDKLEHISVYMVPIKG